MAGILFPAVVPLRRNAAAGGTRAAFTGSLSPLPE